MHILLVNDDGIGAVGIMALMDAALERGHRVTMCAPSNQQSAASQRITLSDPLYVKDYPVEHPNARAFAISGTPADCVRLGLMGGLTDKPDLVLSGINNGYNAGMATHYSGTVGAAMEGALNSLHAVAASIDYNADPGNVRELAEYVIQVSERYVKTPAVFAQVLNINAPNLPAAQWQKPVYAPLSESNFQDGYERRHAERVGVYYWLTADCKTEPCREGTDQWYLEKNHVVLTLMGNPVCACEEAFATLNLLD